VPCALGLRLTCTFTLACCLLPSNFLLAQSRLGSAASRPKPSHDFSRLGEWLSAIDRHEAGSLDAAAITIGSWRRDQLDVLFGDVRALLRLISAAGGPRAVGGLPGFTNDEFKPLQSLALQVVPDRANRLRKRGALLHADIAMLVPPAADRVDEPTVDGRGRSNVPQRVSVVVADGRERGMRAAGLHWDFGRTLLDSVTPNPSRDEMVRLWYQATAAWQLLHHEFADAVLQLERAREVFPADPRILLISGGLSESFAAPRIQDFIRTSALPTGVAIAVPSERVNLRRAAAFYRRAVEIDPDLTEARIRLGRVLGLQGRHEEAVRELQRVDGAGGRSLLQYYTALFLGAEEEALGRADRAGDAFRTASALYPKAQSPYLALSRLAWRSGDRAGALGAIQPVLTFAADEDAREDPWWQYYDGTSRDAEALLDRLRRVFQNGAGQ
jgi:tetratricopeptide (TPR) repeat protein